PIIIGYLMINKFMYSNKGINKLLLTAFIIAFVLSWVLGINSISLGFLGNSGVQNYEIIPYYGSVYKSWKMINQCDFMIATRLHAAIIAAFADVPFILNEYHQKCTDFLDDWSQNTKFRVGDAKYDYDKIVNNIYLSLYSDSLISKNNKENLKKLAYNNFSFFHTY